MILRYKSCNELSQLLRKQFNGSSLLYEETFYLAVIKHFGRKLRALHNMISNYQIALKPFSKNTLFMLSNGILGKQYFSYASSFTLHPVGKSVTRSVIVSNNCCHAFESIWRQFFLSNSNFNTFTFTFNYFYF